MKSEDLEAWNKYNSDIHLPNIRKHEKIMWWHQEAAIRGYLLMGATMDEIISIANIHPFISVEIIMSIQLGLIHEKKLNKKPLQD